jgi:hypothetical protein
MHRDASHPHTDRTDGSDRTADLRTSDPDRDLAAHVLGLLGRLDPAMVVALGPASRPGARPDEDLAVRPLVADPRCGGAGLFGVTVPAGTRLVGATFVGRTAAALDAAARRRVDVLVTRRGSVLSQVHGRDGTPVATPGPAGGVVVDALHRLLDLPCPGPTPSLTDLVVALWLQDLLALCTEGDVPSWSRAVARLPCPPASGAVPPSDEAVAQSLCSPAPGVSWDRLRRAAATGRMAAPELSAAEAEWMDATFFARWVMESFAPPDVALVALHRAGAATLAARLGAVLDRVRAPRPGGCDPGGDRRGKLR